MCIRDRTKALLRSWLPLGDYDVYLCGPPSFTQALYGGLRAYNIADARIHAEAFGPSSLVRRADVASTAVPPRRPASTKPVSVVFTSTLKEARWTPEAGTLLELAESRGLSPEFSCRAGTCGTCRTKLSSGAVTYLKPPAVALANDEVLPCIAVPAEQEGPGEGRIELAL